MIEFPMPDFGPHVEEILSHALRWLALIDQVHFLQVLTAFIMAIAVIRWIITTVKNPPSLDI